MSFLKGFFGKNEHNDIKDFWIKLESETDLETLLDMSFVEKCIIFKHSTNCHISKIVLKNFENGIGQVNSDGVSYYFLDLLQYRNISNLVAQKFNVKHESPQILIIKEGEVIQHASHQDISHQLV